MNYGLEQQQLGFKLTTPLQTPTARPSIVHKSQLTTTMVEGSVCLQACCNWICANYAFR